MSEKQNLRPIDSEFGSGSYVSWEDGETKTVLLTNWGQYDKEVMVKNDKGKQETKIKVALTVDVLRVNDVEYIMGDKTIDTTSINFQKELKPFFLEANNKNEKYLYLKISRKGDNKNTTYFIERLPVPTDMEVEVEAVN